MDHVQSNTNTNLQFLRNLDQKGMIIAEYIWIDGAMGMRSKTRTLGGVPKDVSELPDWNYDGSSTYQATTENSEIILKPAFFFPDPFRGGENIMVLCETYTWKDTTYQELIPSNTNFRVHANKIFDALPEEKPWFGIEQEYTLLSQHTRF
jgi:glutamine synthetase